MTNSILCLIMYSCLALQITSDGDDITSSDVIITTHVSLGLFPDGDFYTARRCDYTQQIYMLQPGEAHPASLGPETSHDNAWYTLMVGGANIGGGTGTEV